MSGEAEYARLLRDVERTRMALNATRWWQWVRRGEAADRYKSALLRGALWELTMTTAEPTNPDPQPTTEDA